MPELPKGRKPRHERAKMAISLRYAACASIALACLPLQASAKFVTFQVPGATATVPGTITNKGVVIGFFTDPTGQHGFMRAPDGTFTTIDVPGGTGTIPVTLKRDGTIAGNYADGDGRVRGFIRSPTGQFADVVSRHGTDFTALSSLSRVGWVSGTGKKGARGNAFGFLRSPNGHYIEFGEQLTVVCANAGHTTAGSLYANGSMHGFVRTPDGTITQFDPAGSVYTTVSAIDAVGTTIGYFKLSSGIGAGFVRAADGTLSTFAVSGKGVQGTGPLSINKNGAIAGYYQMRGNRQGGFVRTPDGTITTIDVPHGSDTEINSINDKGHIAGEFKSNGIVTGFIWKP